MKLSFRAQLIWFYWRILSNFLSNFDHIDLSSTRISDLIGEWLLFYYAKEHPWTLILILAIDAVFPLASYQVCSCMAKPCRELLMGHWRYHGRVTSATLQFFEGHPRRVYVIWLGHQMNRLTSSVKASPHKRVSVLVDFSNTWNWVRRFLHSRIWQNAPKSKAAVKSELHLPERQRAWTTKPNLETWSWEKRQVGKVAIRSA